MPLERFRMASSVTRPGNRLPWRIAFISDPHGDRVALDKVISDLEGAGPVDEVLVGGDLAQGGAQPAEVIDEIRKRGWSSVRGNGDDLLVRIADGHPAAEALREREASHGVLPETVASHAVWSVNRIGPERISSLPPDVPRPWSLRVWNCCARSRDTMEYGGCRSPRCRHRNRRKHGSRSAGAPACLWPHTYAVPAKSWQRRPAERGGGQRLERCRPSAGIHDCCPRFDDFSRRSSSRLATGGAACRVQACRHRAAVLPRRTRSTPGAKPTGSGSSHLALGFQQDPIGRCASAAGIGAENRVW
jgi:Calcineurin-like phosphoesterase